MICNAPDCENDRHYPGEYCSAVCRNVALRVAARRVDRYPGGEVTADEIREIRAETEANFERVREKIEEADDE